MKTSRFSCEICDSSEFSEIAEARAYTGGQPIYVCRSCGLVQVIDRRSPEDIAKAWEKDLFQVTYTARNPAVKARQAFVAEFMDQKLSLNGKSVCDIGAGEGYFIRQLRDEYGADVFGVEPSTKNCALMKEHDVSCFDGTIERFRDSEAGGKEKFDIVTILWALEACSSPYQMLRAAHGLVKEGGHIVIGTGSRVLVPFKKPLQYYITTNPLDTCAFRFSANTLEGVLAKAGFEREFANRYVDNDVLCMIGRKSDPSIFSRWSGDSPDDVLDFFSRWHRDSEYYAGL